jgi:hypothetical protein
MSLTSHTDHGTSVRAHIHHSAGRGCRTPARPKAPSSASTCAGPHGQPPHHAAGSSGESSRASHPARQAIIGYLAASGSGATTAMASATCHAPAGGWAPLEATWWTWVAPMKHNASVTAASAAYAARRSCGERQFHAGAGLGPASTWMRPRPAADAISGRRLTVSA